GGGGGGGGGRAAAVFLVLFIPYPLYFFTCGLKIFHVNNQNVDFLFLLIKKITQKPKKKNKKK
ncbi:hypothetical protein, partial [Enterobacter hormaechei]